MVEVIDAIYRRRSIRRYTDQPVELEKLEILLNAAMAAPSAANSQPWEFVVVTERKILDRLRRVLIFGNYAVPAAIVVCANIKRSRNLAGRLYWVQDCSAALENILLAAVGLGLGTVWIGVHPRRAVAALVRTALNIPRGVEILGIVYTGYPAEEKEPRSQYDASRVFWQAYRGGRINGTGSAEPGGE